MILQALPREMPGEGLGCRPLVQLGLGQDPPGRQCIDPDAVGPLCQCLLSVSCSGGRGYRHTVDLKAIEGAGKVIAEMRSFAIGKY